MKLKPATEQQADDLKIALGHLRTARIYLAHADCPQTLDRVRLAISSAKGAARHMERRIVHTAPREWSSSTGRIRLTIASLDEARSCSGIGSQDANVRALSHLPRIRKQLDDIDRHQLRAELREVGAWDDTDLQDHEQNLQRLLWIACCDIAEGRTE